MATGMQPNNSKSIIIMTRLYAHEQGISLTTYAFTHNNIGDGLNYLGFHIKLNDYQIKDWNWLIAKEEQRINTWYHRWLSRAGCLVLIKSILEAILVYWMSLAWIPIGVTKRITIICRNFLWRN